jgi:putative heme-binding domain-containing protein
LAADLSHGRELFSATTCYNCHRIQLEGGVVGPDLTAAGHRFTLKDLLTAIIEPSKEIPDQYEATIFQMEDGQLITGRVANLHGDQYWVQSDMNDPGAFVKIKVDEIEDMAPSKVSMMPSGLLDTLEKKEVYDLLAYLKSAMSNSRP